MKTKSISNERHTALIFRHTTDKKKIIVKWFENEFYTELEKWPAKILTSSYKSLNELLEQVEQYAEKNGLTIWSY